MPLNRRFRLLVAAAALMSAAARAATLAVVDGVPITDADVAAATGGDLAGERLRVAVDKLVERQLILEIAERKGLAATAEEVNRAAALAAKAYGPNRDTSPGQFRRHLAEEITISHYIDLYIYPRIPTDEATVKAWFVQKAPSFMEKAPRTRAAREEEYPRYRNEAQYYYVRSEIARILGEEAAAARKSARVKVYVGG